MAHPTTADPSPAARAPVRLIGFPAGIAAGLLYLAAQCAFAIAFGGTGAEPFQRIGALLLGPGALRPSGQWSVQVVSIGLFVHLCASALFGDWISILVLRARSVRAALLAGALAGAALFVVNRLAIAPLLFPWFNESLGFPTAMDHVLFGVAVALVCAGSKRMRH